MCTKMVRNLREKLIAKFPATIRGFSMAKIARLDDAFSKVFEREASLVKGQSLQQEIRKRKDQQEIRKGEKGKTKRLKEKRKA